MPNEDVKTISISLGGNSDKNILKVLEESNEYLDSHDALTSKIDECLWVLRDLEDLLPQTPETLWSGHMFPIVETNTELESSIQLCKFGFYKYAFIALRNILELGLLSVYWDVDDKSHVEIQNWLHSFESTPYRKKTIFPKLKTNQNIKKFDDEHKFFDSVDTLFGELSNFVHTKGRRYSSMDLGNANFNRFNEKSLLSWIEFVIKVVKHVVIVHVLKYPVALQHTSVEQKFGLNGPAGLFLEPYQSEKIKHFLDSDILKTLQEISDNDPEAQSLRKWIEQQSDISQDKLQEQINDFEKIHPTKS